MIIIAGDSWGCGEWQNQMWDEKYTVSHAGLAQYLINGHRKVTNLSQPGGSNYMTWTRLEGFLMSNPYFVPDVEKILVFQTEWDRDLMIKNMSLFNTNTNHSTVLHNIGFEYIEKNKPLTSQINLNTANSLSYLLISNFYLQLSRIAVEYNVKIELIGGCSDVVQEENFTEQYPNVKIVCESLTNLLISNDPKIKVSPVTSLYHNQEIINFIRQRLSSNELEKLMYQFDLSRQRDSDWRSHPDWFWPDGVHPNRAGHQKLYEFLLENW